MVVMVLWLLGSVWKRGGGGMGDASTGLKKIMRNLYSQTRTISSTPFFSFDHEIKNNVII
jgi:hypothetical protein